MCNEERDLLKVLKAELEFLNGGRYARLAEASWRPVYVFEDSCACVNHDYNVGSTPCGDCVLAQLVPPDFRSAKFPCRHIPLNAGGETLDSLYRYSDEHEIEETVRFWLQATIAELEEQRRIPTLSDGDHPAMNDRRQVGTALLENAKCANPACPVFFDWHKGGKLGGKFFRFQQPSRRMPQNHSNQATTGIHGVKHFWLCELCSHLFTLVADGNGVVLRPRLTAEETDKELSAA